MTSRRGGVSRHGAIPEHCLSETLQRIGVGETDMMGIVHHGHYVDYFERGRLEYMRRRGLSYKDFVGRGLHMPVIELNVRYKKPAYFDDLISVETRLAALTRVTVRFDYVLRRPVTGGPSDAPTEPELLLEAMVMLACVDARHRPRGLPEDVVQMLFSPECAPPLETARG
jgi:acyl-CoA thioester hydrolase